MGSIIRVTSVGKLLWNTHMELCHQGGYRRDVVPLCQPGFPGLGVGQDYSWEVCAQI